MINQWFFILLVSITGYMFLLLGKNKISRNTRYFLSLPIGICLWSSIVLIAILTGLPHSSYFILPLSLLLPIGLCSKHLLSKTFSRNEILFFLKFVIVIAFLDALATVVHAEILSNDSLVQFAEGAFIGNSLPIPKIILAKNGLFSAILQSSSFYFGFSYLYALYPLLYLSFFLFFADQVVNFSCVVPSLSLLRIAYGVLTAFFVFSPYFVLFNALYIHSNMIFGLFSFLALFSLWKRMESGESFWLFLFGLSLIYISFARLEGPIFGLILLSLFLFQMEVKISEKIQMSLFLSVPVLIWHVRMFFLLHDSPFRYFSRNEIGLIILVYIILLGSTVLLRFHFVRRLFKWYPIFLLTGLAVGWTIVLFTRGFAIKGRLGEMTLREYGFLLMNIIKDGNWGVLWIGLFFFLLLSIFLKKIPYESVFMVYIAAFFFLYNIINIYRGGWRIGWGDSGNRMLLHVVFPLGFYIFLKIGAALFSHPAFEDEKRRNA